MSHLPRDDSLTLTDRKQIDGICLAFEDEWLAGCRPVVEGYLRQVPVAQQPVLLKELLLLELDYRRSLHEVPHVDDYLARFPACAASVQAAFQDAFVARGAGAASAGEPDWSLPRAPHARSGRFCRGVSGVGRTAAAGRGGESPASVASG